MNKEFLIAEQNRIDELIKKQWAGSVALDGIGDIDSYLKYDDVRICWFLKEPVLSYKDSGTPYSYRTRFTDAADAKGWRSTTFGHIAIVSYGIMKCKIDGSMTEFDDLPKISLYKGESSPHMEDSEETRPLDFISVLNVKKQNGASKSNNAQIIAEYNKKEVKDILFQQIKYINPQVVIVANRVEKLAEDLAEVKLSNFETKSRVYEGEKKKETVVTKFYFNTELNRLVIYARHPSMLSLVGGLKPYYTDLVNIANSFIHHF